MSVLNLRNKKITSIVPDDCHSLINSMTSLNDPIPYATGMECDGKKKLLILIKMKRCTNIESIGSNFPDKNISLGNWTDSNDRALLLLRTLQSFRGIFVDLAKCLKTDW